MTKSELSKYKKVLEDLAQAEAMASAETDPEMKVYAQQELTDLQGRRAARVRRAGRLDDRPRRRRVGAQDLHGQGPPQQAHRGRVLQAPDAEIVEATDRRSGPEPRQRDLDHRPRCILEPAPRA